MTELEQQVSDKASELLAAAHDFWKLQNQLTNSGAVKWVLFDGGELLIFTRGEYRTRIMQNIDDFRSEVHVFGVDLSISPELAGEPSIYNYAACKTAPQ